MGPRASMAQARVGLAGNAGEARLEEGLLQTHDGVERDQAAVLCKVVFIAGKRKPPRCWEDPSIVSIPRALLKSRCADTGGYFNRAVLVLLKSSSHPLWPYPS